MCRAEIREHLGGVKRGHFLSSLEFNYDRVLNDQVHSMGALQLNSLIVNRQVHLSLKFQPKLIQLITEALFIGGFQQSRTQMTMNLNGSPDNPLGDLIKL